MLRRGQQSWEPHDSAATYDRNWWIAVALTVLIGGGGSIVFFLESARRSGPTSERSSQAALDRQVADVRAGKTRTIRLSRSQGTDNLIRQLKDVPGVERLELDLTDVTDRAMDDVARLPGLRRLRIYGGVPGIGDQGLVRLKPLSKLEELEPHQYASHRQRLAGPQVVPAAAGPDLVSRGVAQPYVHSGGAGPVGGVDQPPAARAFPAAGPRRTTFGPCARPCRVARSSCAKGWRQVRATVLRGQRPTLARSQAEGRSIVPRLRSGYCGLGTRTYRYDQMDLNPAQY